MKQLYLAAVLLLASAILPFGAEAQTYEETVEKINYNHSVQLGGDRPFYAAKDIGSSDPTLQVYIWADLGGPFSQSFLTSTFPMLLEKYGDVARFSYQNTGFIWLEPSLSTGLIGECAAKQGAFWVNVPTIISNAETGLTDSMSGVDQTELKKCIADPTTKMIVQTSNDDAKQNGITGDPTIIIQNLEKPELYDIKVKGFQTTQIFEQAFQEALNGDQTDQDVEEIKQQIVDLETAIQNTQNKVETVEAEQSRLSIEVNRLFQLVQSIIDSLRGLLRI